jgi:hypothetical protein
MTGAVVVQLDRARERRGLRRAQGAEPRARWLAELATWPKVFRRRVAPLLAVAPDPDQTLGWHQRRIPRDAYGWGFFEMDLAGIRQCAATLREARRRGHRGWITRRENQLEASKAWLLEDLFARRMRGFETGALRAWRLDARRGSR